MVSVSKNIQKQCVFLRVGLPPDVWNSWVPGGLRGQAAATVPFPTLIFAWLPYETVDLPLSNNAAQWRVGAELLKCEGAEPVELRTFVSRKLKQRLPSPKAHCRNSDGPWRLASVGADRSRQSSPADVGVSSFSDRSHKNPRETENPGEARTGDIGIGRKRSVVGSEIDAPSAIVAILGARRAGLAAAAIAVILSLALPGHCPSAHGLPHEAAISPLDHAVVPSEF